MHETLTKLSLCFYSSFLHRAFAEVSRTPVHRRTRKNAKEEEEEEDSDDRFLVFHAAFCACPRCASHRKTPSSTIRIQKDILLDVVVMSSARKANATKRKAPATKGGRGGGSKNRSAFAPAKKGGGGGEGGSTHKKRKKMSKEEDVKPNSSKFGSFQASVANFPKFDPKAGSSTFGICDVSHKDHKRWTLDLRSDWRFFHVVSFVVNFSASLRLPVFRADELERGLLFPEDCSKLIELMCRLMAENEKEGEKEIVKETLTIGDWEGQLIWLCRELADENPDEFPHGNPLDKRSALVDANEAKMDKLKTFFSVDPMTRLDILCALCEDKAVQSEIVKANMEDRAERARKVERVLELENEKKRTEMKKKTKKNGKNIKHLNGVKNSSEQQHNYTDDATAEVLRDRDVHGHSVGIDSEGRYYFSLGDASPRIWRWDKLKEADTKEVFSYDGVEPAWQTICCTLEETEALALVLERSSGTKDRELARYLKNAFIPLHAKRRAAELEAKKRKEAKRKEQEARDKREAEYRAQENRKRSGRIAVKMIEQEQARLEKIKQEKWESDKVERRRAALITMNEEARNWMFLPLRLREKTKKPAGLPVDAFVAQKGKEKPKAVFNRPDAMFVSLKDLNKTKITKKKRMFGAACVNKFFSILWSDDGGWYDGCVVSYDEVTREHFVAYQDGSTENVNLDKQRIKYKYDVVVTKHVDEATNIASYFWQKPKKAAAEKELSLDDLLITQHEQQTNSNNGEDANESGVPAVMLEYVTGHHPGTVLALDANVFDASNFHRHKPTFDGEDPQLEQQHAFCKEGIKNEEHEQHQEEEKEEGEKDETFVVGYTPLQK